MTKILTRAYTGTLVSIDNMPVSSNTIRVVRLIKQYIRAGMVSFGQPHFEWFTALDLDPKESIVFRCEGSQYTLTGVAVSESTFDSLHGSYTRGIAVNMSPTSD